MQSKSYSVTIEIDVYDAHALIKEARRKAREQNTPLQHCNTRQALQWLLDPGVSPPGTDIQNSSCEEMHHV